MRLHIKGAGRGFIIAAVFILPTVLFLSSRSGLLDNLGKEAKEEKKILGYVEGYNPRVKDIEDLLKEEGFYLGQADGIIDKETRMSVRAFQRENKLKETGFIDSSTHAKLELLSIEKTKKRQAYLSEQARERARAISQRRMPKSFLDGPFSDNFIK